MTTSDLHGPEALVSDPMTADRELSPRERIDNYGAMMRESAAGWRPPFPQGVERDAFTAAVGAGEDPGEVVRAVWERSFLEPRTWTGRRHIAIVGYTSSAQMVYAPEFPRAEVELWGMNDLWATANHRGLNADVWVDLHDEGSIAEKPHHAEWLTKGGEMPVIVWPELVRPEWPGSIGFPVNEIGEHPAFHGYFTNTVSWQLALAITQLVGVPDAKISIYGVNMAQDTEYAAQRPSCEFFIGLALGLGIAVEIPMQSDLLKTAGLYGRGHSKAFSIKMADRKRELQETVQQFEAEMNRLQAQIWDMRDKANQARGALIDVDYLWGTWGQPIAPNRDATTPTNPLTGQPAASDGHTN